MRKRRKKKSKRSSVLWLLKGDEIRVWAFVVLRLLRRLEVRRKKPRCFARLSKEEFIREVRLLMEKYGAEEAVTQLGIWMVAEAVWVIYRGETLYERELALAEKLVKIPSLAGSGR